MKIVSFNINGLRAHLHQLDTIIKKYQPDIIGLQETKVADDMFPLDDLKHYGYHIMYYGQKSHYGVALLSRYPITHSIKGFPDDTDESQRRFIQIEVETPLGKMHIINGYFPQGSDRHHPTKFPAKAEFYQKLKDYIVNQSLTDSPLIIMGDMNVCPNDIDIGLTEKNKLAWLKKGKCSFLPEERAWLQQLLNLNLFDTYRYLQPDTINQFSWFDYRSKGFDSNTGLRIDLILANHHLRPYCHGVGIDYDIRSMERPSDHAPIWCELTL